MENKKIKLIFIIYITLVSTSLIQAQSYFPLRNVETNLAPVNNVNGQWIAVLPTNNTLGSNYYQGISFGFDTNNYASLVNGVGTNDLYFGRWSSNWEGWNKIWHSGNLNKSSVDFTAKNILASKMSLNVPSTTSQIDACVIDINSFGTNDNATRSSFFMVRDIGAGNFTPFIIKGNGNIGIGTKSPAAILDVNLTLPNEGKFNSQKWSTSNDNYNLTLQTIWNNHGINQQFIQRYNGIDYTSLSFYTGNVGIGLSNPDEKLTVKGKIHAEEVRVDLAFPAPDYVFAKDYKLKSLQEVENFIIKNNHLPEIPSAKEIEKNGLMLAEMNMSLLKKIEELTLYMIEQNKRITTLEHKLK